MSFLLDHDTCQAWMRGVARVQARLVQHQGSLHVAAPTVMGVTTWLLLWRTPLRYQYSYMALMNRVRVLPLDRSTAERAALLRGTLWGQSPRLSAVELMVVAVALENNLTLVTHDIPHYAHVPGLTLVDWMVP